MLKLGTSSWSHESWRGTVYSAEAAPGDFLREYAARFETVEIDATWYRIPSESMVKRWARETPDRFVFAAKVPSSVTHEERLAEAMPELNQFVRVMENLGPKLGPLLLQFPYAFKPEQFDVLARFLEGLPSGVKFAVEVRHKGWLNEKFYDLLRSRKVALALIDLLWMPRLDVLTVDWTYLRFIGDRKGIEKKTKTWEKIIVDRAAEMAFWAPKIQAFLDKGIPVWAYFNNHYAGHAPGSVDLLKKSLGF